MSFSGVVFTFGTVRHWKRLSRGVVQSPSLEVFKIQLHKALSNYVWPQSWPCIEQELGIETQSHFQPELFCDLYAIVLWMLFWSTFHPISALNISWLLFLLFSPLCKSSKPEGPVLHPFTRASIWGEERALVPVLENLPFHSNVTFLSQMARTWDLSEPGKG